MSSAVTIPLGVFIAVLVAVRFSATGGFWRISRQEEMDEPEATK